MLKKILFLGATVALAFSATTANAGAPAVVPAYDVAPVSGSFIVIGSEEGSNGSVKIFKDSAKAQALVRLALGSDANTAVPNEKNYVLGLATPDEVDGVELVVWNKVTSLVAAEVATISFSDDDVYSAPAEGKSGTFNGYAVVKVKFIGAGNNSCSDLDTSLLSGRANALAHYVEKFTVSNQSEVTKAIGTVTPVSVEINRLLGNLYADEENNNSAKSKIEGPQNLVITDGGFKANLAVKKKLGTSTQPIKATGCGSAPAQQG